MSGEVGGVEAVASQFEGRQGQVPRSVWEVYHLGEDLLGDVGVGSRECYRPRDPIVQDGDPPEVNDGEYV